MGFIFTGPPPPGSNRPPTPPIQSSLDWGTGQQQSQQRQYSPIERPDLNNLFGAGLNVAVAAGRAPGYVASRPLAWLDTATSGTQIGPDGKPRQTPGVVDQVVEGIRNIPVIGGGLSAIGDFLSTPWVPKLLNSGTAQLLAGTYGLPDATPLGDFAGSQTAQGFFNTIPGLGFFAQLADKINGSEIHTVGDLRKYAYGLGFTPEDAQDINAGKKGIYDFGDLAVHENPLFNFGTVMATDPTNLLLGAGIFGKIPGVARGLGMLGRYFSGFGKAAPAAFEAMDLGQLAAGRSAQIGRETARLGEAFSAGRNLSTDLSKVTYQGFANTMARLGRGTTLAGRAYIAAGAGLTGAELGLTALGDATNNTPIGPLVEPFAEFAARAQANQSLADNVWFSLAAAFKFPYRDALNAAKSRWHAGRYARVGSDIDAQFVDKMNPGPAETRAARAAELVTPEWFGSDDAMIRFKERVYSNIIRRLSHKYIDRQRVPESMAEVEYLIDRGERAVNRLMGEAMRSNRISSKDFIEELDGIGRNSRVASDRTGGMAGGLEFPFDGRALAQEWVKEWEPKAAELAMQYDNRSPVVVGLMDTEPLPLETIQFLQADLETAAGWNNGVLPRDYMISVIRDHPQLLRDEPFRTYFGRFLTTDGPDAKIAEVDKILRQYMRHGGADGAPVPSIQHYLYEIKDWERHANVAEPKGRAFDPTTRKWDANYAPQVGQADIVVPSYLSSRARRAGDRSADLADALQLRAQPNTRTLEDALPEALRRSGYNVESISQHVGYSQARSEVLPEVNIALTPGPQVLDELHQVAAATMQAGSGKVAGQADEALIVLSGRTAQAVGKAANAAEYRWQFGQLEWAKANALVQLVRKVSKSGVIAKYDDTTGTLRIFFRDRANHRWPQAEIDEIASAVAHAVPEDPATGAMKPATSRVYLELIANDSRKIGKRAIEADEVLSNVRSAARADIRYQSAVNSLTRSRTNASMAQGLGSAGLRRVRTRDGALASSRGISLDVPVGVADAWQAVEHASEGTGDLGMATDRFLEALHASTDVRDIPAVLDHLRVAAEARLGSMSDVLVSRMRPELGEASDIQAAQALRSQPAIKAYEADLPEALRGAGLPVEKIEKSVGAWEGGAEPASVIRFGPSATLDDMRAAATAAMTAGEKNLRSQQDAAWVTVSGAARERLGLGRNVLDWSWKIGPDPIRQQVALDIVHKAFGGSTLYEDGTIRVLQPIRNRVQQKAVHEAARAVATEIFDKFGVKHDTRSTYAELVANDYKASIRKEIANADPTASDSFYAGAKLRSAIERDDPRVHTADRGLSALVAGRNPGRVRGFGGRNRSQSGAGGLAGGHSGLSPALDDVLTRAHEDFVATGGNMGQVVYNARLDALSDVLLPQYDGSISHLSELAGEDFPRANAEFQRRLLLDQKGLYTLKSVPHQDVPYVYSTEAGKVWADNMAPQPKWVARLFSHGPLSTLGKWQRQMFGSRNAFEAADSTKQEFYNLLLNKGATMAEINGYMGALRSVAELNEVFGARLFRSWDALPLSVYEKIALGKNGEHRFGPYRLQFGPGRFRGFSPEVIAKVGEGNFWKMVDAASSGWWRGVRQAARAGGTRGEIGRLLQAIYPKGMGIRHYAKIWYHAFRFLTDIRWWAMNSVEAQTLLGMKYGTVIHDAYNRPISAMTAMHLTGQAAQNEAALALDAALSGWYDARRVLGPMSKTFDQDAPRTVQRYLDSLPETDPIIGGLEKMFGKERDSWGKQLTDQLYDFDTKGVQQTVVGKAKQMLSEDDFNLLDQSGFLQRIWELNEQSWADISHTVRGNPNRSTAERLANSYWLYWPISYQIKAAKWLYDVLTDKMFGRKTSFAGAWELNHIFQLHERLMRDDKNYAQAWADKPETWFVASMFLPITPFDLSVTLSRPLRYALGALPEEIRPWQHYKGADNLFDAVAQVSAMGPIFTHDLLEKLAREQDPLDFVLRPFRQSTESQQTLPPGTYSWPQ